jgi:uncharacterized protein (DUF433 family)
MDNQALKSRITLKPEVCGGRPCIRDPRIEIAVILDGLAEGLTETEIIDHYPQLSTEDISAIGMLCGSPSRRPPHTVKLGDAK